MSVKEVSRAGAEVPTSTKATKSSPMAENVHLHSRSEATFASSGMLSATEGTACAAPVRMAAVEESLYALIDHGPYQLRVLGCAMLGLTAVFMEMLAFRVIARPVNHWCRPPGELAHLPADVHPCRGRWQLQQVHCLRNHLDGLGRQHREPIRPGVRSQVSLRRGVTRASPELRFVHNSGWPCGRPIRQKTGGHDLQLLLIATLGCSVAVNFTFFLVNRVVLVMCGTFSYLTIFILVYEVTGKAKRWLFALLHMAMPVTFVPPLLSFLSAHDASWVVAYTVFIVPTAAFALWCSHLGESPTWLLATMRLNRAEPVILTAARLNNVDEQKARQGLRALFTVLRKMKRSQDTPVSTSLTDTMIEDARTRRHAIAAIFSRFACGGIVFGLMTTEKLPDTFWQVGHVVFSVACFTTIKCAMDNYGPRDTLSGFLAAACVSAAARAASAYIGLELMATCARLAMRVFASGSMGVIMCYLGDLFPVNYRCTGVGPSIVVSDIGATLGIVLARVDTVRPGFVFDIFYAIMMLLSVFAVQWLPEVLISKPIHSDSVMSSDQRKLALQASLTQTTKTRKRRSKKKAVRKTGS
ncbi:hypothetical protein HPB50_002867 [Hyalomma asiaticum]|uniref:Uncharacterized protein n=1 Tax=Hyalomma asiaticum TaxID=266040 RepID=A0ACB7SC15_HYAAI|nr:hypothetical protein HPB50_002867 [Hyalomma asiaticum]